MLLQKVFLIILLAFAEGSTKISDIKYVSHKNCNGLRKGSIIAHPTDCSKYVICNGLRSTLGECSTGSYYNAQMLSCEKIQLQQNCMNKKDDTQTKAPTTTTLATITENEKEVIVSTIASMMSTTLGIPDAIISYFGRPVCKSNHKYYITHPLNCSYYYYCGSGGNAMLRRCNTGYSWDWIRQRCLKSSVAKCYGSSI